MSTPKTLRPEVLEFAPYVAGLSIDEIRERYRLDRVIKMASNENPLGVSPVVQKVLREHAGMAFRYPQTGNPRLVEAIADRLGVAKERIVAGNGSDEIIDLLIRAKARPGRSNIIAFDPCFSMYKLQARLCGVEFRQTPLNPDFSFPWSDFLARADENTAIAFVTTPDNPSGYAPPVGEIEALAKALPEDCLLVVDEAYMDFALPLEEYSLLPRLDEFDNVVVLRTFSKMYGLAGLRLGFGVMPPWLAEYIWRIRMPFSVNILAEYAGVAALEDRDFYNATLAATVQGRDYLEQELAGMGCRVRPSCANFILFALPAVWSEASRNRHPDLSPCKALFEALLAKGIIIRPMASYGLHEHLRVSIGDRDENRSFITAMRVLLQTGV